MPGKVGMKWGYNNGVRNGNRVALTLEQIANMRNRPSGYISRSMRRRVRSGEGSAIDPNTVAADYQKRHPEGSAIDPNTGKGIQALREANNSYNQPGYGQSNQSIASQRFAEFQGAKAAKLARERAKNKAYNDAKDRAEALRNETYGKIKGATSGTKGYHSIKPGAAGTPEFNKKFTSKEAILRRNQAYQKSKNFENKRLGKSTIQNLISDIRSDKGRGLGREILNTIRGYGSEAKDFYGRFGKKK